MLTDLRSELISRGDLGQLLLSSLQTNENVLSQLHNDAIEIYRAGFLAALKAVATAYEINLPQLREAEASIQKRHAPPTRYDMRL